MNKNHHVLIIGGGIAGPALAMFLQKAGIQSTIYEARSQAMDEAGAFLNLAPNGVNVLKLLDLEPQLAEYGFPSAGIHFFNAKGKRIGQLDSRAERERYGASNYMIKRGLLHRILRDEAQRRGIPIEFGKRLTEVEVGKDGTVTAHLMDEQGAISTAHGDLLIGCDGIHSRTRRIMLPDAPQPAYTGQVDSGGFAHVPSTLPYPEGTRGAQVMTFGKRAFFGYIARTGGNGTDKPGSDEVYWFSNVQQTQEPQNGSRSASGERSRQDWKQRLLDLHAQDPAPIPAILAATDDRIGKWPIYDMPPLPTWYRGPICLVGDAAHATSPHIGQGASLALEDAAVLAKCLRDIEDPQQAFAAYEAERKERVEKLVQQARRQGDRKIPHPLTAWFRDLMLPFFLKMGASSMRWVYDYKVNWNERATPPASKQTTRQPKPTSRMHAKAA